MIHFGTDGIRKIADAFLVNNFAQKVGQSLVCLENPFVIIAQDSRESSAAIKDQVIEGAKKSGLIVYDMGLIPTPVLAFLSHEYKTIGVMITASHNPYQDNGIKILNAGKKLSMHHEQAIEELIENQQWPIPINPMGELEISLLPYVGRYANLKLKTDLKIGFDVANGAGSQLVPHIVKRFIKQAVFTNYKPDGKNINANCGSTHLDAIKAFVKERDLDIGFSLDGDGDRVLVVDRNLKEYDGDLLIYIMAVYLKQQGKLKQNKVVLSIMSNLGIIQALKKEGIQVVSTPVGDKYVMEEIEKENLTLGGEAAGHIINTSLLNSGDGTLNAMFLLKIIEESGKNLSDLIKDVTIYPEKLVNLRDMDRTILNRPDIKQRIETYRRELGEQGKVIVRASGTEPLIRISVSASSYELVDAYIAKIIADLKGS